MTDMGMLNQKYRIKLLTENNSNKKQAASQNQELHKLLLMEYYEDI